MQITKKQLKELLKEAIMELVEDGQLTTALQESIQHPVAPSVSAFDVIKSSQNQVPQYLAESGTGQLRYEPSALSQRHGTPSRAAPQVPNQLTNLVKQTAYQQGGNNSLMESIFADTAVTTFAQQREGTNGLIPEGMIDDQQIVTETKKIESLAVGGDITRWAKVAALSMKK